MPDYGEFSGVPGLTNLFFGAQQIAGAFGRQNTRGETVIFGEEVTSFASLHDEADLNDQFVFQINPASMNVGKSVKYKFVDVPGLSDPIGQFLSGGKQAITLPFTLAERTGKRCPDPELNVVESAINWLESKMVPTSSGNQLLRSPPKLIFQIGNKVDLVKIEDFKYRVVKFFPDLTYKRVECTLTMFVSIDRHRNPSDMTSRL